MELGVLATLKNLLVALAIGLLIGAERGWQERATKEGGRVAGIRTFGLIGLFGGLAALLYTKAGAFVLAAAFIAFGIVLGLAEWHAFRERKDLGATTMVAAVIAALLGVVAGLGELEVAGAAAVVVTLLLGIKPQLHGLLERVDYAEVMAVLKLLLMSVVLLPVLPDQGFGPYEALNPYRIWLLVVLVASIHFLGYLAIRFAGAKRGVLATGVLGGLITSTTVTLTFSRLAQQAGKAKTLISAGIVVASSVMFLRMLLFLAIVAPELALTLGPALATAGLVGGLGAAYLYRLSSGSAPETKLAPRNPFELGMALKFGLLLASILLLARLLEDWLGASGLYVLAAASGLADVDAAAISFASLLRDGGIALDVAARALLLAAAVNTAVKIVLSLAVGGLELGWRVGAVMTAALLAGLAALLLVPRF